jgi:hypothetical protein
MDSRGSGCITHGTGGDAGGHVFGEENKNEPVIFLWKNETPFPGITPSANAAFHKFSLVLQWTPLPPSIQSCDTTNSRPALHLVVFAIRASIPARVMALWYQCGRTLVLLLPASTVRYFAAVESRPAFHHANTWRKAGPTCRC